MHPKHTSTAHIRTHPRPATRRPAGSLLISLLALPTFLPALLHFAAHASGVGGDLPSSGGCLATWALIRPGSSSLGLPLSDPKPMPFSIASRFRPATGAAPSFWQKMTAMTARLLCEPLRNDSQRQPMTVLNDSVALGYSDPAGHLPKPSGPSLLPAPPGGPRSPAGSAVSIVGAATCLRRRKQPTPHPPQLPPPQFLRPYTF